jgi:hypothetical protein
VVTVPGDSPRRGDVKRALSGEKVEEPRTQRVGVVEQALVLEDRPSLDENRLTRLRRPGSANHTGGEEGASDV